MCLSYVRKVDVESNQKTIRGSRGGKVRPIRTLITKRNENRLDQAVFHTQSERSNLIQIKQDSLVNNKEINHAKVEITNVRSVPNKDCELFDVITSQNLEIFLASETWIKDDDESQILDQVTPAGYTSLSGPRTEQRGGGVAAIYAQVASNPNNWILKHINRSSTCVSKLGQVSKTFYL